MLSLRRILPAMAVGLAACCTVANADPPTGNSRPITIHGNHTESVNRKGGGNDVAMESLKVAHEGIDAAKLKLLTSKSSDHREGTDPKRMSYNPKEIMVDKVVPWQKRAASFSTAEILVRGQAPQPGPRAWPPKILAKFKVPKGETNYVSSGNGGVWKTTDGGKNWVVAQQPDASQGPSIDMETKKLERMIPLRKANSTDKSASGSAMTP